MKRTKIVCTLGPASAEPKTLEKLLKAGMNVARLNMSHGTHERHHDMVAKVRAVSKKLGVKTGILVDLQGPKIRVGVVPSEGVQLVEGKTMVFSTDPAAKAPDRIPVTYPHMHKDVRPGDHVLMDDGLMDAVITSVKGRDVHAKIVTGGTLFSNKGFNLPQTAMSIPAMSDKDYNDARFAVREKADYVALSFVRNVEDVAELRKLIGNKKDSPKIVVKIEKPEGVANFDAILEVSDAVMVARGDLGIEIPAEQVPFVQKMIVEKCNAAGKPVIVATQMLDSMIRNPRPTRAEVSDVANAVIDHTDAVMLSGETANGKYPVEAVSMMAAIVRQTEESHYDDLTPAYTEGYGTVRGAIAHTAGILAEEVGAKAIVVATMSGDTARYVSRVRPELPIYAAVTQPIIAGQLTLSWGVFPFMLPIVKTIPALISAMQNALVKEKKLKKGDRVVLVAGSWKKASEHVVQVVEV